jgi:2-amino-4-hydroxy-6-hydroxymethyldihydropteridine diphosphokinase
VLCPLADLAGEEVHPVAGRTYRALWASFPDKPEGLRPVAFDPEPVA